jgi:hypothetical protein
MGAAVLSPGPALNGGSPMNIRRVVPDIPSKRFEESRAFYMDFLAMKLAMDMDFILTFVSQAIRLLK